MRYYKLIIPVFIFLIISFVALEFNHKNIELVMENSFNVVLLRAPSNTFITGNHSRGMTVNVLGNENSYPVNISDIGWTWRRAKSISEAVNKTLPRPVLVRATKRPDNEYIYDAIVVYYSTYDVSGSSYYNYTFCYFVIDYNSPTIDSGVVSPDVQLINWFNITASAANHPEITTLDIAWISENNISIVYTFEEIVYDSVLDTYKNAYYLYFRSYNITSNAWMDPYAIRSYYGYAKNTYFSINTTTGYAKYLVFTAIDTEYDTALGGKIIVVNQYGRLLIFDITTNTYLVEDKEVLPKTVQDLYSSNTFLYDGILYFTWTAKYGEGDSELLLIKFDGTSYTKNTIFNTEDYASSYGVYADFSDPTIAFFSAGGTLTKILHVWIAYTEMEKYVCYAHSDLDGNAQEINLLTEVTGASSPQFPMYYSIYENASLLIIDYSVGTSEISQWLGYWNGSNWIWKDKQFATKTNTSTLTFSVISNGNLDIFIQHISYRPTGELEVFPSFGYADYDKDGVGDWEEENVYSTNSTSWDTDNDGINDGAEIFIYGTNPNSEDSDNDHLTDKFELSIVKEERNYYKTDPLTSDTDGDGLDDYSEVYGKLYNESRVWNYQTNPLSSDTDSDGLGDFEEIITGVTYWINSTDNLHTAYPNASRTDSDNDGILDYDEKLYKTNPTTNDTDNDGLSDYHELTFYNTDPHITDCDDDGLSDYDEIITYSTDPFDNDTDDDTLTDYQEIKGTYGYQTDPLDPDTDGDGIKDGEEISLGTSPLKNDTDNDDLTDLEEINVGTNPNSNDTDGDGLLDGAEYAGLNITGLGIRYLDPTTNDTDGDGLSDYDEAEIYLTDPTLADSDGDGLNDYDEIINIGSDPLSSDTDDDGLDDYTEFVLGTDIFSNDTDNDDLDDYTETLIGTNPLKNDTDDDKLLDSEEYRGINIPERGVVRTDPLDPDTDDDGLIDGDEILLYHTNPTLEDSDGDGLSDYSEVNIYGTDPTLEDSDSDGLDDYTEALEIGSNPLLNDTDNDGLLDGTEYTGLNITGIGVRYLDPTTNDTDGDGLSDYDEAKVYFTDPTIADSDGDGLADYAEVIDIGSDPLSSDTDDDGLDDYTEFVLGTDIFSNDTDNDDLDDYTETLIGTDPLKNDTDDDKLLDSEEYRGVNISVVGLIRTDPLDPDTDDDGLIDGDEVLQYRTNPTLKDSDGDGLSDYSEVNIYGTNPSLGDSDSDGLNDYMEVLEIGSDPLINDTDGDGLLDGEEYTGLDITGIGVRYLDPTTNDTDGDGLSDYDEAKVYFTDPTMADSDGDGLSDYVEIVMHRTNPLESDSDGDKLSDYEEIYVLQTDPLNRDSDGDGIDDYLEVRVLGTNPLSSDTDGDLIPDNLDWLFPNFKDELLILVALFTSIFAYAVRYGVFRNWRKDVISVGLSDPGGTLMFSLPEEITKQYDPNLISSALIGIHQLTSEISGYEEKTLVLAGKVTTIIRRGNNTYLWVFTKRAYPKLIRKINHVHGRLEKQYSKVLANWTGFVEYVKEIQDKLRRYIFGGKEEIKKAELELEELAELEPVGEIPKEIEIEEE